MNILYITNNDPRDTSFGSAQRTHLLWCALSKIGTVYTVYNVGLDIALIRDDDAHIASWHLASKSILLRYAQAIYARWFAPAVWPYRRWGIIAAKMPWQGIRFDKVVVRYVGNAAAAQAWRFGALYVDVDDLPTETFRTVTRRRLPWLLSVLGQWIVATWQRKLLRKCKAAWIANPNQVAVISRYVPCMALPNLAIPPHKGYAVTGRQKRQLMFVGALNYEPNLDGVDWFLKEIWPHVYARHPDLMFAIAGRGLPERYKTRWGKIEGVNLMGFVEDLDKLYEESLAVVSPINSGSGTCIKVIEAMLHGRYVFATRFSLRGLKIDCRYTYKFSAAKDFISKVEALFSESETQRSKNQLDIARMAEINYSSSGFCDSVRFVLYGL